MQAYKNNISFYFNVFGKVANKTHMIVEFFIFEKKVNYK